MMRDVGAAKGLYGNSIDEAWYGGYVGDGAKTLADALCPADCRRRSSSGRRRYTRCRIGFLYANP